MTGKKKALENQGLNLVVIGGGGGDRTPVRESAALGTTCLVSLYLNL